MNTYGYAKITLNTNGEHQEAALREANCEHIYIDDCRTIDAAPEITNLLRTVGTGDLLIIDDLLSIARCSTDLVAIVTTVLDSGANIQSINQPWMDTVANHSIKVVDSIQNLMLFETSVKADRIKTGMRIAAEKGQSVGRPSKAVSKIDHAMELYDSGNYTAKEICGICSISKSTLYRSISRRGVQLKKKELR